MFNLSKKIGYALLTISLIVIGLWACSKKQSVADNANFFNSETHQRQLTQALENVATLSATNTSQAHAKDPDGEDILFFDLVVDKENDSIYTENHRLVFVNNLAFGLAGFEEKRKISRMASDEYVVSCRGGKVNGKKGDWEKSCDGTVSCAKILIDCMKQGGCGTICNKPVAHLSEKIVSKFGPLEENPEKWSKLLTEIYSHINDPLLGAEAIAKK